MKKFISLCLLLSTTIAAADVVRGPIHSVEEVDGNFLIKFESGRVAFSKHPESVSKGDVVEVKVDEKQNLLSIQTLDKKVSAPESLADSLEKMNLVLPPVYEPTLITSYDKATEIFNRLNPNYVRASECSNRAHVWAHEEFKNNQIKSLKTFVFFTAAYINRVRLKWWFHVAPALTVQEGSKVEIRVLDYMFNRKPLTVKEWTDQFVFNKRECKYTTRYSEHDPADQSQDCYIMIDSMYHWMPGDLKNHETLNQYKTKFFDGEVGAAKLEAFN